MISSHICQLSTKQQLMTALEIGRRKKLRDKKHSTRVHKDKLCMEEDKKLEVKLQKAVCLRGRGKNASFPSQIVMASSPKKHCMCPYVWVFLNISLANMGNKGKRPPSILFAAESQYSSPLSIVQMYQDENKCKRYSHSTKVHAVKITHRN